MPYKPFPIIDEAAGLSHGLVSWKSPESTYQELLNARIHRGVVERRNGYTFHGILGTWVMDTNVEGDEIIPNTDFIQTTVITPDLGKYDIVFTDDPPGSQTAEAKASYTLGLSYPAYNIRLSGGGSIIGEVHFPVGVDPYFNMTWTPFTGGGGTLFVKYRYARNTVTGTLTENMVMAVPNYLDSGGAEIAFAMDRRRVFLWSAGDDRYDDSIEADVFTCEPGDFFFAVGFEDKIAVCNNVDPIFYYDAAAAQFMRIHVDWVTPGSTQDDLEGNGSAGGYVAQILAAKICIRFRNRLVLLSTIEIGGDSFQRRARWSSPVPNFDSGDSWQSSGWKDCPTDDVIVGATLTSEELIVWFSRSIWRLAPFDDVIDPFRWERLSTGRGARAPGGVAVSGEEIMAVSDTDIIQWDGRTTKSVIPDYKKKESLFRQDVLLYSQAYRDWDRHQWMFSFEPKDGPGIYPTRALVIKEEGPVSEYEYPFHVYGVYYGIGGKLWDDFTQDWDDTPETFDSAAIPSTTPVRLAGGRDQKVYRLESGLDDDGAQFEVRIQTQRINPFRRVTKGQGWQRCKLGFIDLIIGTPGEIVLNVEIMSGFKDTVTKSFQVTISPKDPGTEEQVIRRFLVNRLGPVHSIRVRSSTSKKWTLEGMVLWMRPAGKMRDTTIVGVTGSGESGGGKK